MPPVVPMHPMVTASTKSGHARAQCGRLWQLCHAEIKVSMRVSPGAQLPFHSLNACQSLQNKRAGTPVIIDFPTAPVSYIPTAFPPDPWFTASYSTPSGGAHPPHAATHV